MRFRGAAFAVDFLRVAQSTSPAPQCARRLETTIYVAVTGDAVAIAGRNGYFAAFGAIV
ncbi:hypothetical protein [Tropicimonas marinistellae]|uniref:hypothetical protein n=1 Tax=Tropicimonas marinistellae TaxID=1739787 RepID=UPI0013730A72|nr:hypothetical protein [Tropicimonas marinistellae]